MFPKALFNTVDTLINRSIDQSPAAKALSAELEGRSLSVNIRSLFHFRIQARDGYLETSAENGDVADVKITGSLIDLNRLMFIDPKAPIREGRVTLEGNEDIADQFHELLREAQPNFEEELAKIVGDSAAFHLGNAAHSFMDWMVDAIDDVSDRLTDYLQDDLGELPTRAEAGSFFAEVDDLANDLARFEARIALLRTKLEKG